MMDMQIETKNLNVFYGKHHVIKNVNIRIPKNKITVLLGPSGCGKTTLLKSFNRLLELRDDIKITGKIVVDGEDILHTKKELHHIRKKMGLILQKPSTLPMSIYDNIAYGLRIHGEKNKNALDEAVMHSLKEVSLWSEVKDRLDHPASQLSLGQQQRLCLARSIAIKPEILLCDEPTSALDPVASKKIESLLLKLKKDYTIVLVTHTLRQAKRLADNVAFVYFGEIIEEGSANKLFNNPKEARTKEFIEGIIG